MQVGVGRMLKDYNNDTCPNGDDKNMCGQDAGRRKRHHFSVVRTGSSAELERREGGGDFALELFSPRFHITTKQSCWHGFATGFESDRFGNLMKSEQDGYLGL
jgi:hypothetical protein